MRAGGVEEDQVQLSVDDGANRAPLAPQLVRIEMLEVELEAVDAEEWPRLQRQRPKIDRTAAHPVQAFEHCGDFRRRHVPAELGHLAILGPPLANKIFAARQS